MIDTDNILARDTLARIETVNGQWIEYGNDGRFTTEEVDVVRQQPAGTGYRARFVDGPHGGDYGWGPLAKTQADAVTLFLAEHIGAASSDE